MTSEGEELKIESERALEIVLKYYPPEPKGSNAEPIGQLIFQALLDARKDATAPLLARIATLEADKTELEQLLHVAPVKAQLAIANHIFMMDAGLCLEVIAPLAHTELMKVGQQILEGVGQYDIQSKLDARVKELEAQVEAARDRAEGYQQGIEDAASFIQTSPHYFEGLDRDADRIAEDMRAMLLGAKLPDPADLPTMMSLRGILNSDEDSEEKETDYNPVPPKATYTAMARLKLVGRGKPLDQ